jgi:DNA-binding NarL/FixJ family response regulator
MVQSIKVLVADDHAIIRYGLIQLLGAEPGIQIAGEARDGLEAIDKAIALRPDIILMDIFMPRCSGIEATKTIKEKLPEIKILCFTVSEQKEDLFRALKYGASGYLLKGASIPEVMEAIRATMAGDSMISPPMTTRLISDFLARERDETRLSEREKEVLKLVGEGLTNPEIAHSLFIGESTVRTHLQRLQKKLHLRNRGETISYANHSITGRILSSSSNLKINS